MTGESDNVAPLDEVPGPDPAEFDPLREVHWTLPMAVAWIAWRTADAVREQWDDWRKQQGQRKASLQLLKLSAAEHNTAWLDLLHHLQEGEIAATGFDAETPRRSDPIRPEEWAGLEDQTTGNPDYAPKFRYPYASPATGQGYDDVVVKTADVRRLWPAAASDFADSNSTRPRRGAPVMYTSDELIIADVLRVLEQDSNAAVAPLIVDFAYTHGCPPRTEDDLTRLVDRVRRKVTRRKKLAER